MIKRMTLDEFEAFFNSEEKYKSIAIASGDDEYYDPREPIEVSSTFKNIKISRCNRGLKMYNIPSEYVLIKHIENIEIDPERYDNCYLITIKCDKLVKSGGRRVYQIKMY